MALELFKSRRYTLNTAEYIEKVWITPLLPDEVLGDPQIPQIGGEYPGKPWLRCVDLNAERVTSNTAADYSQVTATYSSEQELLKNPGDVEVEYEYMSQSVPLRFAKQIIGSAQGADGKWYRTYRDDGALFLVGLPGENLANRQEQHHALRVRKLLDTAMWQGLRSVIWDLVGKINNAEWNGYYPLCLLFLGAEVPQIGEDRYLANFYFEAGKPYSTDIGLLYHVFPWEVQNKKDQKISETIYNELYVSADFNQLAITLPGNTI